MGLEKFLKAVLLFRAHAEYEGRPKAEAREQLNKLAMKLGHDFAGMLKEVSEGARDDIGRILHRDFDGYRGADLVRACKAGYMETRYPVPRPVSETFPIPGTSFTHDPLSSSGITKFIYAVCNVCFFVLSSHVDLSDATQQFAAQFKHRESLQRFNNLFWEPRCKAHL